MRSYWRSTKSHGHARTWNQEWHFQERKSRVGSAGVIRFVRWLDSPSDGFQCTSQSCSIQDSSSTPTERQSEDVQRCILSIVQCHLSTARNFFSKLQCNRPKTRLGRVRSFEAHERSFIILVLVIIMGVMDHSHQYTQFHAGIKIAHVGKTKTLCRTKGRYDTRT